jgi:exodeoxyribonuclease V
MEKKSILEFLHFGHPTSEQEVALKAMEEFVNENNDFDFLILCGAAGTGKTSVTAALIGFLNHLNRQYKIAAPTGRAARILGRKAKSTTSTIHSLIYTPKPDDSTGKVAFKLKMGFNQKPTIYIIDEASMIPKEVDETETIFEVEKGLLFDLISYIKGANVNNKVIFLGDKYQLPPIGETQSYALNKDFLETTFNLKGSVFLLTEVKRQTDGSYILENSNEIRKAIDDGKSHFPIKGTQSKNIYSAADNYVKGLDSNGLENSVSIGVSHKANKFFNDLVRERIFGKAKKILESGDLLMVTQNWQRNGISLYNGDHLQLISVDWSIQEQVAGLHFVTVKVKLLFSEQETIVEDYAIIESILSPGGKIDSKLENELRRERYIKNKIFRESTFPWDDRYVGALKLMYGHAITCNKAQGGEWKKIYINTLGIPSLKWQYTAVTRGIDEIEKF